MGVTVRLVVEVDLGAAGRTTIDLAGSAGDNPLYLADDARREITELADHAVSLVETRFGSKDWAG